MSQIKGQVKTLEKQLNEVDIGERQEKVFRIMIVKVIHDLGKRMQKCLPKNMQKCLPYT